MMIPYRSADGGCACAEAGAATAVACIHLYTHTPIETHIETHARIHIHIGTWLQQIDSSSHHKLKGLAFES